jgi:glycerate 2-kinase
VLEPIGKNLSKVKKIKSSNVIDDLKSVKFKVACDVTNPLYGKEGAGAAGGMGAGTSVFLNAELKSGIDLVKSLVAFDEKIKGADWIITGEGKLDSQTLSGKTIDGVITAAKKHNIPVAALCGSISLSKTDADALGISYTDAVMEKAKSLDDAMANGYDYVKQMAINFAKSIA